MAVDTQQIPDIAATPAWQALSRHHDEIGERQLREFFAEDPERGTQLALTVGDLYLDYSKHRVTRETLQLLIDLARTARLVIVRVSGFGQTGPYRKRPGFGTLVEAMSGFAARNHRSRLGSRRFTLLMLKVAIFI